MPHAGRSSTSAWRAAPHAIWRDSVAPVRRIRARHDAATRPLLDADRPSPHPRCTRAERISSPSRLSPTFSIGETHVHNGFLRT